MSRHQLRNCRSLLRGERILIPSLGSMTLDRDDVELTRRILKNLEDWYDSAITDQFEDEFAKWNGSKHAYSFMGGRVALSACLAGLDLSANDEIILPGYTCVVVPNAIKYAGLKPVYADIELETYGLSLEDVKRKATGKTRAIIVQHLFGLVCKEIDAILRWAKKTNIFVIEDCAHATGATYQGKKVGNFGDAAFFSCEQSKILNVVQGGIATTNDDAIASRIQQYSDAAPLPTKLQIERQLKTNLLNFFVCKDPRRWYLSDWYNYRLGKYRVISTSKDEIAGNQPAHYGQKMPGAIARLGLNQLAKIDQYNELRRQNAAKWNRWCDANGYQKPVILKDSKPVYLRYPVMVEPTKKQNLDWARKTLGVAPGVWFVSQVHPASQKVEGCPQSEIAVQHCINMPTLLS